jgi:5,10-methylenetetrahydrofolate reductase
LAELASAPMRMSPMALGVLIQQQVGTEVVLHYTCRDRNLLGIQSDLLVSLRNAQFMRNEVPGAFVPDEIMERMQQAEGAGNAKEEGLKVAVEILAQGLEISVPLGRVERVLEIMERAGIGR